MTTSQLLSILLINKEGERGRAHSHNSIGKVLINLRNLIFVNTKTRLFYRNTPNTLKMKSFWFEPSSDQALVKKKCLPLGE